MRHRINQRVDAERVAETREPVEVRAVFAFALEGVAVIRIVRDEHHQMGFVVKDRAGVWLPAVGAALRGLTAGAEPEVDRRNLRHALHLVQRVEDLVATWGSRRWGTGWLGRPSESPSRTRARRIRPRSRRPTETHPSADNRAGAPLPANSNTIFQPPPSSRRGIGRIRR